MKHWRWHNMFIWGFVKRGDFRLGFANIQIMYRAFARKLVRVCTVLWRLCNSSRDDSAVKCSLIDSSHANSRQLFDSHFKTSLHARLSPPSFDCHSLNLQTEELSLPTVTLGVSLSQQVPFSSKQGFTDWCHRRTFSEANMKLFKKTSFNSVRTLKHIVLWNEFPYQLSHKDHLKE